MALMFHFFPSQQNPAEGLWEDPALEKLHLFCEESRSLNEWVPEITLPERWSGPLVFSAQHAVYLKEYPSYLIGWYNFPATLDAPEEVLSPGTARLCPSGPRGYCRSSSRPCQVDPDSLCEPGAGMPRERHNGPHSLCGWGLERKEFLRLLACHRANITCVGTRRGRSGRRMKHAF